MTDHELIRAAIKKSGLSHTQFALQIVARDGRQVRRWLAGNHPIPRAARQFLERYVAESTDSGESGDSRGRLVRTL